jgi:hypothetical protein
MPLIFYPHEDDAQKGALADRITVLLEAAERYKAAVLEIKPEPVLSEADAKEAATKRLTPHDFQHAYNWEEIVTILQEVRSLPEGNQADKLKKIKMLTKLAEVYEVLRGAKMSKLEAVRLALMSEAKQLESGSSTTSS